MDITQAIVLALIQGITEFLPVSSSAHLILLPKLLNWSDQGLIYDVTVHLGSLTAIIFHYRKLLINVSSQTALPVKKNLFVLIFIGSLPVIIAGYLFSDIIANDLRLPLIIAGTTIIFALLLWFADYYNTTLTSNNESNNPLGIKEALLIGGVQVLALIPGTSRAGVTLTAGLLLGLSRTHATHFSFLLAIPIILALVFYGSIQPTIVTQSDLWPFLAIGFITSALFTLITVRLFLKLLDLIGLLPFIIYRLVLGGLLLLLFL